jgi:VanZ family protein
MKFRNLFFAVLSAGYIFSIFYGADSSAAAQLGEYNPFSLLHIPLYGFLAVLLNLALWPDQEKEVRRRRVLAGVLALLVGSLDEYHQTYLSIREGSVADVVLDGVGILLALVISEIVSRKRQGTHGHEIDG